MKEYIPQIRIISVDHARTTTASQRLRHALDALQLQRYPVRSVFCHLESGRCGVKSGTVAVEVDGRIVWGGAELTQKIATQIAESFEDYVGRQGELRGKEVKACLRRVRGRGG